MQKRISIAVGAMSLFAAALVSPRLSAAEDQTYDSTFYVAIGLEESRGGSQFPALLDVSLGDTCILVGTPHPMVFGPLSWRSGDHAVEVREANGACTGDLIARSHVSLVKGKAAVAVIVENDTPEIMTFEENFSPAFEQLAQWGAEHAFVR